MIGSKVVLGFDGAQVMRGLQGIGRAFGKLGSTIGRGAMERVGHRMTDLMGRIISAVPEAISETLDFAGEMNDLSKATDTSVSSLVKLREMLRLSGAESVDTGRMLANLSKNLFKANTEGGDAAEALHKLGLRTDEFGNMDLAEAFEKISEAVGKSNKSSGELVDTLGELFGGKIGYKIIPLMRDFSGTMARAGKSTSAWGAYLEKNAAAMDEMGDAMGRWQQMKMGLASMFIEAIGRIGGGSNGMDALFDFLNPEKIRPMVDDLVSTLLREFEVLLQQGPTEYIKSIFRNVWQMVSDLIDKAIAKIEAALQKIGEDIKNMLPKWMVSGGAPTGSDIMGGIKGMFGITQPKSNQSSSTPATKEQASEQINLLKDIRQRVGVTSIA